MHDAMDNEDGEDEETEADAPDVHFEATGTSIGSVVQIGSVDGDVYVGQSSEVRQFVVDFATYLTGVGGSESILALVPSGLAGHIFDRASKGALEFVNVHYTERQLGSRTAETTVEELLKTLTSILADAWMGGYFIYKFRKYGRVPLPDGPVDPSVIWEKMTTDPRFVRENLGSNIEVHLQKVVSILADPATVRRNLDTRDSSVRTKIVPFLDPLSHVVHKEYGWGLLAALVEEECRKTA